MNSKLSLIDLYNAGSHRGNHKSRLNPKLKKFVHQKTKDSTCIIDLTKTMDILNTILPFIHKLGQQKKQIFIVGTSNYLTTLVPDFSKRFKSPEAMPYVDNRWLGGTLTNWVTVRKTLKSLEKLENILNNTDFFEKLSRNEQLNTSREYQKKNSLFGGLKTLKSNRPGAVIILDTVKNPNAILEAETVGIPIISFTNLNTLLLPKDLSKTLVFNNTSVSAIEIVFNEIVNAYNTGLVSQLEEKI